MGERAFETLDYKDVFKLKAVGPYGAVTKIKPGATLLFFSGLVSRDPETGEVLGEGDVAAQTVHVMERIKKALAGVGATFADVYYLHIYLAESVTPADKDKLVDPAFGQYFEGRVPPCNVVAGIKRLFLPKGEPLIEIEAWAAVQEG